MEYRIIASDAKGGVRAVIERIQDGRRKYVVGPREFGESCFDLFRETDEIYLKELVKRGMLLHNPPISVENYEDWMKLTREYHARAKQAVASSAAD